MTRFEDLIPGKVIWGIPQYGDTVFALIIENKNIHVIVTREEKKTTLGRIMLLMPSGKNMWFDTSSISTRDYDNPFETNLFDTDEENAKKWILSTSKDILIRYCKRQLKKSVEYADKIVDEATVQSERLHDRYMKFIENTKNLYDNMEER